MSAETLEVAVVESGSGSDKLIAALNKISDASTKLAGATSKSQAATERQGTAARKAATDNDYLARSMGSISSVATGLGSALAGVGLSLGVGKFIEAADAYTQTSNKLRLLTTDQTKINGILEESYKIARQTGTSFLTVADTYGKVGVQAKRYGLTAAEVTGLTRTIAQSIQLTGASADAAKRGLLGFNQMLDLGQVNAEELNQVIENTPGLANAISAGIQKSGIAIQGSLKQMAESGKIGIKQVLDGLKAIGTDINTLSTTAAPTLGQAFTNIDSAFTKYIGETDKANGVTRLLAKGVNVVADNMGVAIPVVTAFAGIIALGAVAAATRSVFGLASVITTTLIPAIVSSGAAILTNPLLAGVALAALTAGGLAWYAYGDKVKSIIPSLDSVGTKAVDTANGIDKTGKSATTTTGAVDALGTQAAKTTSPVEALAKAILGGGKASDEAASGTDTLEKAQKALEIQFQASSKAAAKFADALDKQSSKYNAYGEKLQDINDFLKIHDQRVQEDRKSVDDWLKSVGYATDTATGFSKSVNDNSAAADSNAQAWNRASTAVAEYGRTAAAVSSTAASTAHVVADSGLGRASGVTADGSGSGSGVRNSVQQSLGVQEGGSFSGHPPIVLSSDSGAFGTFNPNTGDERSNTIYQLASSFAGTMRVIEQTSQTAGERYLRASEYINSLSNGTLGQYFSPGGDGLQKLKSDAEIERSSRVRQASTSQQVGFATGGSFMVGGSGGTDSQDVRFRASPTERVTIETPGQVRARELDLMKQAAAASAQQGQGRAYQVVNLKISTPDFDGFRRNQRQIGQDAARRIAKAG